MGLSKLSIQPLLILLLLAFFQQSLALPADLPLNGSSTPLRRQCEAVPGVPNGWHCDLNMPTVQQAVDRMHDTENGGRADANRRVIFYTGLGPVPQTYSWWHGWLHKEGWDDAFYWAEEALDRACM